MAKEGLSKEVGDWKALNANVKARLPELPQLSDREWSRRGDRRG